MKPGHTLMDWNRLCMSGNDLAGTGGYVLQVTMEELKKHRSQDDAWMALDGKVFNVTEYMDFHPGGVRKLMLGAGRDATRLFNRTHAWVNWEYMMAKCFVGVLVPGRGHEEAEDDEPEEEETAAATMFPAPEG
eukprot:CAMPEP_0114622172 /NCGR_PEP_ID=MMETSP0168-20121206/9605_1 /TAXON_ID=95228 ORGANISM="Vannella sp., Strain DIVA3 517/6/12" /NCGR_SAMPLE_ID=MMETSP0168 /ASSEMBLY_ACC=CAM_ASM_000044 /LENGTH=132 /DNA_ID=CAMNT_0001833389 /DNA_START=157 /DNA_END=551 /DNA_ORIENTATION=+